ncbi:MAG: 2-C-methyl-D-erythritol 4-phosphate cytidylyltransferase [Pseudomonadota bacterium]|nr:2-C-methyl-D-erythritol 4-phosphate cytidylyltransferase [Pseudomonadota bacterium]
MLYAIMPAAGRGARMDAGQPKQYLPLGGRTVIEHALAPLLDYPELEAVVVVLAATDDQFAELPVANHPLITTCQGGASRADSVLAGLGALREADAEDWVLVHDAARPCLRPDDLDRLIRQARRSADGGLLAVPARDTLKQVNNGLAMGTLDRAAIWQAQTPQMFRLAALRNALEQGDRTRITDEASAIEMVGGKPRLVEGHGDNLKVTWLDDLPLAEASLRAQGRL